MASGGEMRTLVVCADPQTIPPPGESKFLVQPSLGWSMPSVHRPDLDGLLSATGCSASIHHRGPRRVDAVDASSGFPAEGRHRQDHPSLHLNKTPSGIEPASAD